VSRRRLKVRRSVTPPRSLHYDTLVIAIGSITNDFGTPGVSEHAIPLETPGQAVRFNPDSSTGAFAPMRSPIRFVRGSYTSS
jgi:NADH dehydrogenase FAD-containing subunit